MAAACPCTRPCSADSCRSTVSPRCSSGRPLVEAVACPAPAPPACGGAQRRAGLRAMQECVHSGACERAHARAKARGDAAAARHRPGAHQSNTGKKSRMLRFATHLSRA
jgi:hypothetical protein